MTMTQMNTSAAFSTGYFIDSNSTSSMDERYDISTLFTSLEGTIVCSSLSSLSFVASIMTIVIILRSYEFLSSVYHRLILSASIANMLFSLAMALNTLPMPKDMLYTQFEGWHIGNQMTCNIQGFVFVSAIFAAYSYFASLLLYYLCSITFKMRDEIFRKFLEPILHGLNWIFAIFAGVYGWINNVMNPSLLKNWCAREVLPFWCTSTIHDNTSTDTACIRGNIEAQSLVRAFYIFCFIVVVLIMLSIILIIFSVFRCTKTTIHRVVRRTIKQSSSENVVNLNVGEKHYVLSNTSDQDNHHQSIQNEETGNNRSLTKSTTTNTTKVILVQISAYLSSIALFSTGMCILFPYVSSLETPPLCLQYFALITTSTYGIIHFCIFVGHKVYNFHRVNPTESIRSLIWKVLTSRNETIFFFENVEDVIKEKGEIELSVVSDVRSDPDDEDENGAHGCFPDPIKRPHVITMFHLKEKDGQHSDYDSGDEMVSLPSSKDHAFSISDNDLLSHNDGSSSFRRGYGSDEDDAYFSLDHPTKLLSDVDD